MTTAEFFTRAEALATQLAGDLATEAALNRAAQVRGAVEYLRPLVMQLPADGIPFWFVVLTIPELRPLASYGIADWSHMGDDGRRLAATSWPTPDGRDILQRALGLRADDDARWQAEIARAPAEPRPHYVRSQSEDDSM